MHNETVIPEQRAIHGLQVRMHHHRAAGEHQRVADLAREGLEAAQEAGLAAEAADFSRCLAEALNALDDYPAMLTVSSALAQSGREAGDAWQEACGRTLRSTALRSLGDSHTAVLEAEAAVRLLAGGPDHTALLQAHQALIAGLVENGRVEHAWDLHPVVEDLLTGDVDRVEAGKAHWTLGNLAFLTGRPQAGTEHHHRAAPLLSTAGDVLLWARFNKACAEIRLQADLADADTADCIHKAELAYELLDPSDADRTGLALAKARWERANGNAVRAEDILAQTIKPYLGAGFPSFLIPVYRLWGQLLRDLGGNEAGATDRASDGEPVRAAPPRAPVIAGTRAAVRLLDAESFQRTLQQAADDGGLGAVLVVGLASGPAICEHYGRRRCEEFLQATAEHLPPAAEGLLVGRFGDDALSIALPAEVRPEGYGNRLLLNLSSQGVQVWGTQLDPRPSVGIAEVHPGAGAAKLLEQAEAAMHRARRLPIHLARYEPFMLEERHRRTQLRLQLLEALRDGQIHPVYQPIAELRTLRACGAEALARWNHPTEGTLAPDRFIPLVQEAGLQSLLTQCILEAALADLADWRTRGLVEDSFQLHVNVEPAELRSLTFPDLLRETLHRWGIPAHMVAVEVTERLLVAGDQLDHYSLGRLDQLGIHTHIDDFGAGHSSISYLQTLPVHGVKTDRSILADRRGRAERPRIVKAVLDLVAACGLDCIVEGIETAEDLELAAGFGVRAAQGYYLSRPVTGGVFAEQLATRRPLRAGASG
jgi:diguanylate cyclase